MPVHVLKTLTFHPRDDEFRNASTLSLPLCKKLAKDPSVMAGYFPGAKLLPTSNINEYTVQSTILHEHTETKFLCDFEVKGGELVIRYENRLGEDAIVEYVVRTVGFLLRKDVPV